MIVFKANEKDQGTHTVSIILKDSKLAYSIYKIIVNVFKGSDYDEKAYEAPDQTSK